VVAYAEELRNLGLDEPALRELTDIFVRARAVAHDGPDVAMACWPGGGSAGSGDRRQTAGASHPERGDPDVGAAKAGTLVKPEGGLRLACICRQP